MAQPNHQSKRISSCCDQSERLDLIAALGHEPALTPKTALEYDRPEVLELFREATPRADEVRFRVALKGLSCSACVNLLEELPSRVDGVREARVNFPDSEIFITAATSLSLDFLVQSIRQLGYGATPLRPLDVSQLERREADRDQLSRLVVAGACAGNIMLFTVGLYAGADGEIASVFRVLSVAAFMPILFYSAFPIYRGAWAAIVSRKMTLDLPLAIALWMGTLASLFNWLRGEGGIYFDSSAGFLFLILLSRWFLRSAQSSWGRGVAFDSLLKQNLVTVMRGSHAQSVAPEMIEAGDLLLLRAGEAVPVDATLMNGAATFNGAWITGESIPRILEKGAFVAAGNRLVDDEVLVKAKSKLFESDLAQSLRRIESLSLLRSKRMSIFDKAASRALTIVVLLAVVMMTGGSLLGLSLADAFERALSLIIVACPCALAFGGPLAYTVAIRKAAEKGILIKTADVLDHLNEAEHLVFDKTGTLTTGELELVEQVPREIPNWMKDLILAFELNSHHPVAYAFRKLWRQRLGNELKVTDLRQTERGELFGIFEGQLFALRGAGAADGYLTISFLRAGHEIARFQFKDRLRSEAAGLLAKLAVRYRLSILSGDLQVRTDTLASALSAAGGFQFASVLGGQSASEKARVISQIPHVVMLGDGVNDGEALATADVGIAVNGSLEQGFRFGSVYFLRPGLAPLNDLFEIARKARALIHRNLTLALLYNFTAGTAACAGWIGPLGAAVLMPASSLLILLSTWRGSK